MHAHALITGGGSGIGRALALALAQRGVHVALVGRRGERLRAVAQEVASLGARAVAIAADLGERGACGEVAARARAELGAIDLLVHAAAVLVAGPVVERGAGELERALEVNLAAPVELTRLVLPDLVARGGSVVFVTSAAAHVPLPFVAAYAASKAGLDRFAESLRFEVEPRGVHVLTAVPPATATEMVEGMAEAAGAPRYPLADPRDVAARIVRAIEARQRRLASNAWVDRLLVLGDRVAPWLVRFVLRRGLERAAAAAAAARRRELPVAPAAGAE